MMRYWEDPPEADLTEPEYRDFTDDWRAQDKVIVSSTLEPPTTAPTQLWRGTSTSPTWQLSCARAMRT